MPNTIQPQEYSRGSGTGGALCKSRPGRQPLCPLPQLERQQVELELQLARQRLECQQPRSRPRNSLHFSPAFAGEFCFTSWPFQPPSMRPISSSGSESAAYFLLSKDFVSQRIIKNIFSVSSFWIALRTYGIFSARTKKQAVAIASTISTNKVSIFLPSECL